MKRQPLPIDATPARDLVLAWVERHLPAIDAPSSIAATRALDWLILAWICETGFGSGPGGAATPLSRRIAGAVAQRLADTNARQAFNELLGCDPLRTTLARGVLRCNGVSCSILDMFTNGLARSLAARGEEEDADRAELCETRLLLSLQGMGSPPPRQALDGVTLGTMLELLQASEPVIQEIATRIALASAYGTGDLVMTSETREMLTTSLSVWLLDFARKYKLDLVSLLVRSLAYLGVADHAPARQAVAFMLAQLHPAGRFGFFGPEVARAHKKEGSFDESVELYLPTTLACMWALAECRDPAFRLVASVR